LPLRGAGYDVFIDFEQFARTSAIIGLLLQIPRRIGFDTPGQGRESAYTDRVPYRNDVHMMDGFYSLLAPLGIPPVSGVRPVPIPTTSAEEAHVEHLLKEARIGPEDRLAIVHPGTSANVVLRRWPETHFARVADFLVEQGFRVVLTGIPAEREIVERVEQAMHERAFNAVGRLSLGELLALLARASLVISNDTGPIHLAAAQGAPVIGLYGPNIPTLYGPRSEHGLAFYLGLPCSPCITNFNEKGSDCQSNICMKLMTAEQVTSALAHLFEGTVYAPTAAGGIRPVPDAPPVHPRLLARRPDARRA
jgi:lipopolysaccharide heptosyltransferase II